MLIFGGYFKVRESFYTLVVIWVKTILNHIDMKVPAWYIDPNGIEYNNIIKYPYPIGIKKKLIPVQHWFQAHYFSEYVCIK